MQTFIQGIIKKLTAAILFSAEEVSLDKTWKCHMSFLYFAY